MSHQCATESCETKHHETCTSGECCPIEKSIEMWDEAFCEAMHEVKVEILKKKIQAVWGSHLDKVGDAILESMDVKWQGMLAHGKSQTNLREKIIKIWCDKK